MDRYRHYKGGEYDLLAVAHHTETGEALAVYRACYGERETWVRPLAMFSGTVEWEGTTVPRFAPIPTVESEILPCPFCGGVCLCCGDGQKRRFVACVACMYAGPRLDTIEEANAAHNRIASAAARAEAAEAERDAMRDAICSARDSISIVRATFPEDSMARRCFDLAFMGVSEAFAALGVGDVSPLIGMAQAMAAVTMEDIAAVCDAALAATAPAAGEEGASRG